MTIGVVMTLLGLTASLVGLVGSFYKVKAWWTSFNWWLIVMAITIISIFIR